jgi:hypothetical protein
MTSIYETIKAIWSNTAPSTSIYEKRIACFRLLEKLQEDIKYVDSIYTDNSIIEGKTHKSGLNTLESYTAQYRNEYERCEKIMKY